MTNEQITALLNCAWTDKKEKPVPQQWFSRAEVIELLKQIVK